LPRTRLYRKVFNPKIYKDGTIRFGILAATGEPQTLSEAMNDDKWRQAMKEDYDALMDNKTWHLVPPSANKSLIECKCSYIASRNILMAH
jgi:hypothetical protein